jgi:hypothetical protein
MDSFLGPQGLFWIFGGFSIGGAYFAHTYVQETSELTDREKKLLYTPEYQKMRKEMRETVKLDEGLVFDSTGNYQM